MELKDLIIFRQELFMAGFILLLLVCKLFEDENKGKQPFLVMINLLLLVGVLLGFVGDSMPHVLFSGMYKSNALFTLEKTILLVGVFLISFQAFDYLKEHKNAIEYYILLLTAVLGMFFMVSSGHLLMLYLGVEMATIPLATLVSFERGERRSAEAGLKMILSAAFSSCFMLFGISIIYGTAGSMYFSELSTILGNGQLEVLGFIFVLSGFAFKLSLVPFHLWTADVYEGSPVSITAFLSVISKGAAVFIMMTVLYQNFATLKSIWEPFLLISAVATMTIGNLFAVRQNNIKRFLAFSSIAQAGYLMLGIVGIHLLGSTSLVYFVLVYIFSNVAAFSVVSIIQQKTGHEDISDYRGLYQTNPRLSIIMMLAIFSLAGIPPTAGFFGKFFLMSAAMGNLLANKVYFIVLLIAGLNMIVSLYYYLRVVRAMLIDKSDDPIEAITSNWHTRIGLILSTLGIVMFGLISQIYDYIFQAVEKLFS